MFDKNLGKAIWKENDKYGHENNVDMLDLVKSFPLYLIAKIGFDTVESVRSFENEASKFLRDGPAVSKAWIFGHSLQKRSPA